MTTLEVTPKQNQHSTVMHKGIKRRYMKRYWLITILLIINSYSFSQKKVTKSELKYNYSKLDVTRILIENLSRYTKKEGIA